MRAEKISEHGEKSQMCINKKTSIVTATVFIFLIIVVGLFSFVNLVSFYVNDETNYNDWTADLGSKFETDMAATFYEKHLFINLNGAVRKLLGQREMNGVLKLNNGHLIIPQAAYSQEEIEQRATEIIDYADFCKKQGKQFLFVQCILKTDEDNKQLPIGTEDFSNENVDLLLECLRNADINVLDIRDCMKRDGLDIYDYTYVTDHHWTSVGCFYAFTQIAKWIESEMGIVVDENVLNIDNYDIIPYEHWHLGSYGQRTGQYFAGIDDYDLIVPTFEVAFLDENGKKHSFIEQVVNNEVFENRDITSRYTYDFALNMPQGVASTSQKLKLLFVSDSYATEMIPYLKLAYSDYDSQYYLSGFSADYVVQSNPDIVVMMPFMTSAFNENAVFMDEDY